MRSNSARTSGFHQSRSGCSFAVVQVVAPARLIELPGGSASEDRLPVVGHLVRPDVEVRPLVEPRMPVGSVIRDEVDQHAYPAPARLSHELVQIGERAEIGVDVGVARGVVAPVDVGRRVDRVEPDSRDAEPLQVVELAP